MATVPKKTLNDFKIVKDIGVGSYSTVFLAIEKETNREFAVKAVSKDLIRRLKKIAEVFREKEILARLNDCAYTVKLYCTFQTESTLYFGLTYCSNGDLLQYINDAGHFDEEVTRFYTAELIEALEQLHARKIIHRDLKPENVLLTDDMHVQIADFGTGVIFDDGNSNVTESNGDADGENKSAQRKNSFVGTPQFVAPEIIQHGPVNYGSDFWSLGCVIFQMTTGKHLFRGHHEYDILNAVVRVAYKIPDDFPEVIGDLVKNLVRFNPSERLGSEETGGINVLKAHSFFSAASYDTKWGQLLSLPSPLVPNTALNSRPKAPNNEVETK